MTALFVTGDVGGKLQRPQWRPGQSPWRFSVSVTWSFLSIAYLLYPQSCQSWPRPPQCCTLSSYLPILPGYPTWGRVPASLQHRYGRVPASPSGRSPLQQKRDTFMGVSADILPFICPICFYADANLFFLFFFNSVIKISSVWWNIKYIEHPERARERKRGVGVREGRGRKRGIWRAIEK